MRTPKALLVALAMGAAVLLAACQNTTPQASGPRPIEYDLFRSGVEAYPSPTYTWDHAGPVEFLGVGMGSRSTVNNPAELVIDDLDSAIAVRVQVAVKYGFESDPDNMVVEFRNGDGDLLASVPWADSKSAVTGDFFEAVLPLRGDDAVSLPGGVIRAEVVNGVSFLRGTEEFYTPRAFVAFVLREQVTPNVTSKGLTSYEDVYHLKDEGFVQTLTETMIFDAAPYDRPLRVDFAISELDPDARVIEVTILVGDSIVLEDTLATPNAGNELYLGYVLTTLPAGETDVEIELFSPDPTPLPEGDSVWLAGVNASVTEPEEERGFEGCTPGFWRNHSAVAPGNQANAWIPTGYAAEDLFSAVFGRTITIRVSGDRGRPVSITDPTLIQAVVAQGGDVNALARHAVAALLNASHPDVYSYYTVEEVIQMVQDALDGVGPYGIEDTKDLLETANELGCPIP